VIPKRIVKEKMWNGTMRSLLDKGIRIPVRLRFKIIPQNAWQAKTVFSCSFYKPFLSLRIGITQYVSVMRHTLFVFN
jgi:hypothetical protein